MKNKKQKDSILSWMGVLLAAIIIAALIRTFVFSATIVLGESMNPTLLENDRLIALKVPLYYRGPHRGDIVILQAPDEEKTEYVKRVVGLPGETVSISNGTLYIDGKKFEEDYISTEYTEIYVEDTWVLEEDEYFVLGDNRLPGKSLDSRFFGPIKKNTIDGIITLRYWPVSRLNGGKL
ncbi:MAG: signal peptidase I [Tissierellia bacterium]|nr:signal peptidase I [Tissierellia bacterium]